MLKKGLSFCLFLAFLSVGASSRPAIAAAADDYAALIVQGSSRLTLQPGQERTVTMKFQNTGTAVWQKEGRRFLSIYTFDPKYRSSVFQHVSWMSAKQPARLLEEKVGPGEVGTIELPLRVPTTEGIYTETFALAAEDTAWVTGGQVTFIINVQSASNRSQSSEASSSSSGYRAQVSTTFLNGIKARGGATILYTAAIKNVGVKTWKKHGIESRDIRLASSSIETNASVRHPSWMSSRLVSVATTTVRPGETETVTIALSAPFKKGKYTASFQMTIDDEAVDGSEINIPIEVTADAPDALISEKRTEVVEEEEKAVEDGEGVIYISEPTLRVGVLIVDEETDDRVEIQGASALELRDIQGNLLAKVAAGQTISASYDGGYYFYDVGRGLEKSSYALRFVPVEPNAVLTVVNFDRRVTRGSRYADNQFRGVLEIRYNSSKDRVWLINELPIEFYLRGLAETSNDSPDEFKKALLTAARTYAYYHWQRATKHAKEFYHVDAYRDQVYKGYGFETRTTKITAAVEETRGQVVTYNQETAITAYFSRSDGRTRDWSEVWGGDVPWSKSVAVPCDEGKKLWGHGVGMSASGGVCLAEEGKTAGEILKYFYTGIEIERRWR